MGGDPGGFYQSGRGPRGNFCPPGTIRLLPSPGFWVRTGSRAPANGSGHERSTPTRRRPGMSTAAHGIASLRDKVSPEEWAVRVDLAACYRLVARYGWEDLVFTHITARVPGVADQFLINPYGMFFDEITASSLVKIDLQGNKVEDSPFPVNPAGFVIHSAIHAALHDDEKPRLVADLDDKTSLILRNHGLLTVGETVAEAFVAMYYLETSCAIQVRAQAGGGELIPVPKEIIDTAYTQLMAAARPRGSRGMLVWPGLLRRLDRVDSSYRD